MADFYTWNQPQSEDRRQILNFLRVAETRGEQGLLPMKQQEFNLALGVLRGMLDLKPSEILKRR
jgi:hypothetical protein